MDGTASQQMRNRGATMSRASVQKRIHYVRAVYGAIKPSHTLEQMLRTTLAIKKTMGSTEVTHPQLGTLAIRHRNLHSTAVHLAIGHGVPGENMATLGIQVPNPTDTDVPIKAIAGRAFKLSDAFCLIEGNELLVCTDGALRLAGVTYFLRNLLAAANVPASQQTFDLVARLNHKKDKALQEGVRQIEINGTAHLATKMAEGQNKEHSFRRAYENFAVAVREIFEKDTKDPAERDALVNHMAELQVQTVINVKGGSRGVPIMVRTLNDVAREALSDSPDGGEVVVVTKNNRVSSSDVTLKGTRSFKRLKDQNGIDYADAWNKLVSYQSELKSQGFWKT
jgi:hypothetical protein